MPGEGPAGRSGRRSPRGSWFKAGVKVGGGRATLCSPGALSTGLTCLSRYLAELCGVGTGGGEARAPFPTVSCGSSRGGEAEGDGCGWLWVAGPSAPACAKPRPLGLQGVKLLSYLYQEALDNCSNEHYPVLLSLLKTSCEPYTRWVGARAGWAGGTGLSRCRAESLVPHLLRQGREVGRGGLVGRGLGSLAPGTPLHPWLPPPHCWPRPSLLALPSLPPAGSSTTGCTVGSSETCMASS